MYYLFQDLEDVGDVYQDESNMAAMLLYKHGHSDEYKMVRHESYVSTACKPVPRPGSQNIPTSPLFLPSLQTLHITCYRVTVTSYIVSCACWLTHCITHCCHCYHVTIV